MLAILIAFPCKLWAQNDFEPLKKELESFNAKDTVIIWGQTCGECGGIYQTQYYLTYTSGTGIRSKAIVFNNRFGEVKKTYDSVFACDNCNIITEFAANNYASISKNFDSTSDILNVIKTSDSTFDVIPTTGWCYFIGIYTNGKYDFVSLKRNNGINALFLRARNLWTLAGLLRNRWPEINLE